MFFFKILSVSQDFSLQLESVVAPLMKHKPVLFFYSRESGNQTEAAVVCWTQEKICKLTFGYFQSPSSWASLLVSVLSCFCLSVPSESFSVLAPHSYSVYTLLSTAAACKHHMMFTINRRRVCVFSVSRLKSDHKVACSDM